MVTQHKATGRALSMPAGLTLGAVGSMSITLVLSIIIAKLVDTRTITEEMIGYGALITLLLASSLGALISASKIKRQKLSVCMISGCIYYILLLCITALFFGGQYSGMGTTALVVFCGCGLVILLGMGQGSGRKKPITKRRSR